MSEKKTRISYDIEPRLLMEIDKHIEERKPMKVSRNVFISMAVEFYLKHIKKGDNK